MKKRLGNVFLASALDSPRSGGLSYNAQYGMYEGCSCIASVENTTNVFKQLSSSIALQTKYHRIQGVRDRMVPSLHHSFFRTFCIDWSGAPLLTHCNAI